MKQKNLILVAVAVGCGLVAAFLTSQMSAKPAAVDQVEIPVAAKDLPVGTKVSKDEMKTLIGYKKFPKEALPAAYAVSEDELADKRLTRTVRAGESFNPQDLTTNVAISIPPGMNMVAFSATPDKGVAGFIGPGSKVDVIVSIPIKSKGGNQAALFPLMTDMLVLAIDATSQYPNQGQAFANMSMVSLAVNTKQGLMLHGALNRGGDLRLVLRNQDKPAVWDNIPTEEEIWAILADDPKKPTGKGEEPKPEVKNVVKLPVPTEDLPKGTQITDELLNTKFKDVEFTPPAPANIVQNLREHVGRFLLNDVSANQFVPKTFLGGKPVEVAPAPEAKKAAPAEPVEAPVYWDASVQTSNGIRKYRYQKLKTGEYKFLGELFEDGSVQQPTGPGKPTTPDQAPDAADPKADGGKKPQGDDSKPEGGKKPSGPVI